MAASPYPTQSRNSLIYVDTHFVSLESNLHRNTGEQEPKIEIRTLRDESMLKIASSMISKYSWGVDYPIKPLDEISKAEFCAGAYASGSLLGFAGVSRRSSPDGMNNGELWFGYAVVLPEFRRQGIFQKLYDTCMTYMRSVPGRMLSCTDNLHIKQFLLTHGWHVIRQTHDESGAACLVFEYDRT